MLAQREVLRRRRVNRVSGHQEVGIRSTYSKQKRYQIHVEPKQGHKWLKFSEPGEEKDRR